MRKQDWLGVLHVGHAGHRDAELWFGLHKQRTDESDDAQPNLRTSVDHKKAEIGGDEFVTAAAGVEFPAEGAEFFDKGFFDEVVDVFGVGTSFFEPSGIVFGAIFDFVECSESLFYFGGGEDADGFEGFGPSAVDRDFVREQATVEREGALERVEARVWFAIEAAAPEAIVFAVSHGRKVCRLAFAVWEKDTRVMRAKTQRLRSFGPEKLGTSG